MAELPENEFLIDLFDEEGNKKVFEHLDTVLYRDDEYVICIPYDDDEEEVTEIVIFKTVIDKDGESSLEHVVEDNVLEKVYEIFKERNLDKFDFGD